MEGAHKKSSSVFEEISYTTWITSRQRKVTFSYAREPTSDNIYTL